VTIDVETWTLVVTVALAVIPWAFSMHAKVVIIANAVEALPEMVEELRNALEEHEQRLTEHDKEIQALKEKAAVGR
jgi:ABC-type molybdate transport system permease subunit